MFCFHNKKSIGISASEAHRAHTKSFNSTHNPNCNTFNWPNILSQTMCEPPVETIRKLAALSTVTMHTFSLSNSAMNDSWKHRDIARETSEMASESWNQAVDQERMRNMIDYPWMVASVLQVYSVFWHCSFGDKKGLLGKPQKPKRSTQETSCPQYQTCPLHPIWNKCRKCCLCNRRFIKQTLKATEKMKAWKRRHMDS